MKAYPINMRELLANRAASVRATAEGRQWTYWSEPVSWLRRMAEAQRADDEARYDYDATQLERRAYGRP